MAANGRSQLSRLLEASKIDGKRLVFIGGGNMARVVILGAVESGFTSLDEIVVSVRSAASAERWKKDGFSHVFTNNNTMLSEHGAGVVFICVKPQVFGTMAEALSNDALSRAQLVVSIMAGISTASIAEKLTNLGYSNPVVRFMPSMPCTVRQGASLVCCSAEPEQDRIRVVTTLAEKIGTCTVLDEKQFNAGAAVASCGPAFVYILMEAMADGGVCAGLQRADAQKLATQAFLGAAQLVQQSGKHTAVLKDEVCSAGGTTIAGVRALEEGGARSAVMEAIKAAQERAEQLK